MTKWNMEAVRMFAVAILAIAFSAGSLQASQDPAGPAAEPLASLEISYLYMGERWVTPPAYVMTGPSVRVRAVGFDAGGRAVEIDPVWSGDPNKVDISPGRGAEATVTALALGETEVTVSAAGLSKRLSLKAVETYGIWRVVMADRSPTVIEVSFLLDPRITRGVYLGERWVSPSTYGFRDSRSVSVKTNGLDARGKQVNIDPLWRGDPEMLAVTPSRGAKVTITVLKEGQSDLLVTAAGASKRLRVKAAREAGTWHVLISDQGSGNQSY